VILLALELTGTDVERVPRENLRVPRDDFAAVWSLAERLAHDDRYAVGVVETCRWLAGANVHPRSPRPAGAGSRSPHRHAVPCTSRADRA
jgi:hypothetical protein